MPTLAEVLELMQQAPGMLINVEIKASSETPAILAQYDYKTACACTRDLCQIRIHHGKFARWTCLLTRKCTVHTCIPAQRTTREAVVTCGQTQHERESFMATPVYAHHPMPHLWGYQSNSQRKDASGLTLHGGQPRSRWRASAPTVARTSWSVGLGCRRSMLVKVATN